MPAQENNPQRPQPRVLAIIPAYNEAGRVAPVITIARGFLPVLAGYVMQTNRLSLEALMMGLSMALFSLIEIKISRPYKDLKRALGSLTDDELQLMGRYETVLKSVSLGVCLLGAGLIIWRLPG